VRRIHAPMKTCCRASAHRVVAVRSRPQCPKISRESMHAPSTSMPPRTERCSTTAIPPRRRHDFARNPPQWSNGKIYTWRYLSETP
jgi:hypothetical protein